MPRKRKSLSLSPQRKTLNPNTSVTLSSSAVLPPPPTMSCNKKATLASMCEMFPNLDPSLVEMVLSEYTEIELVMDYLLELSTSAKEEVQLESTGFEKIGRYMNGFQVNSLNSESMEPVPDQTEECLDDLCTDGTTPDLDVLLDEALDRYGLRNSDRFYDSVSEASVSDTMSTTLENKLYRSEYMESAALSPVKLDCKEELLFDGAPCEYNEATISSAPYEYNAATFSSAPLNVSTTAEFDKLGSCLKNSHDCPVLHDGLQTLNSQGQCSTSDLQIVEECTQSALATKSTVPNASTTSHIKWNPMASVFFPASTPQASFVTPVLANPVPWTYVVRTREPSGVISSNAHVPSKSVWNQVPQTMWSAENVKPISQLQPRIQSGPQISKKGTRSVGKVLILLRGAPGSGKSTLARMLLNQNPTGVILSTDDYFYWNGLYRYDINCLSEAHDWNHKRAEDAFKKNVSPIIIDNTNLQGWEMKPYVSMAMKYKYKVTFQEPDTWWKYKPKELERRNTHGVKKEKIKKMLEYFERVTVSSILNLSHPKEPESSRRQLKDDEKTGASNKLNRDEALFLTPEAESMTSDADVLAHNEESLVSEVLHSSPEIVLDAIKSIKQNQDNTDNKSEEYADVMQCIEEICIDGQYNDDNITSEHHLSKVATEKEDISDVGSKFSQLRPELLSFVGDWPVEQTLRQRAPRIKKHKLKNEQPMDEEKTIKCNLNEVVDDSQTVLYDESATLGTNFVAEASFASHNKTDLLNEETRSNTAQMSIDNVNAGVGKIKPEIGHVNAVDIFFKILQEDPHVTVGSKNPDTDSIKADTEIMEKSSRRSCRQCKLALTFSNSGSSSPKTEDVPPLSELTETVDQHSFGINQSSQTEPYEFAMTWRLEKKNMGVFKSLKVLTGKGVRFKSKSLESNENLLNIPYRMMHHKSTFVEEDEICSMADEDGLQILCKLFKSLSFDVLKDLFERCNKDLQWATNVLLDSGEKMYKDEESEPEDWLRCEKDHCEHTKSECYFEGDSNNYEGDVPSGEMSDLIANQSSRSKEKTSMEDSSVTVSENYAPLNTVPLVVAEELKNGNVLSSSEVPALTNPCTVLDTLSERSIVNDTVEAHIMWSSSLEGGQLNSPDVITNNILNEKPNKEDITFEIIPCDGVLRETDDGQGEIPITYASKDDENTEVQTIIEEKAKPPINYSSQPKESLKFNYLELSLPPEFVFQLTELFGPVGIDPGALTIEDCVVPIDLKLAEAIHKKWKESIMERHYHEALSYELLAEADCSPKDHINLDRLLQEQESKLAEKYSVASQGEISPFPFLDQWNTQIKKVSLRQIMSEEMALQAREDLKKPVSSTNCAVKMKEKQLLELFPNVEQNLLIDVFKESNYCLEKTEEFMSSLLESDPVQNVVAPGFKQELTSAEKTKEKKMKADKEILCERYFQDLELPDYEDFRAEAFLYRKKQQESYRKAAEAHNCGMKQVASYYAQQGYLYGQKMKEEHQRAAVQIFERSNEYLLPENILDLHGLHVDEAMKHFRRVLQDKTEDYKHNGGKPHLLVITGRGNHSQGGVPRIKPAVIDYLTNHNYRFQEKTSGVLRITLKKI